MPKPAALCLQSPGAVSCTNRNIHPLEKERLQPPPKRSFSILQTFSQQNNLDEKSYAEHRASPQPIACLEPQQ
jgi:hypothetical protein